MPAFKGNHSIFTIRLTDTEKRKLKRLAAHAGGSMSDVARALIVKEFSLVQPGPMPRKKKAKSPIAKPKAKKAIAKPKAKAKRPIAKAA